MELLLLPVGGLRGLKLLLFAVELEELRWVEEEAVGVCKLCRLFVLGSMRPPEEAQRFPTLIPLGFGVVRLGAAIGGGIFA